jgi:hypothetical protein
MLELEEESSSEVGGVFAQFKGEEGLLELNELTDICISFFKIWLFVVLY